MPEGRPFPYKYLPKLGAKLSITFGKPVPATDIQDVLAALVRERRIPDVPPSTSGGRGDPAREQEEQHSASVAEAGWLGDAVFPPGVYHGAQHTTPSAMEVARVRSAVTAVIQREVEALGREVLALRE